MQIEGPIEIQMDTPRSLLKKGLPEVLVFLGSLFLYLFQLGQESLWIDEMLSLESAQNRLDLNRPLYFVLLRVWMLFGDNEAWLRLLSVLFGWGCIGLTYVLGRRLVNRQTGIVAAAILALSPLALNHAQEVRFYMMSAFLGVAGSLSLSYALQRPKVVSLLGWIAFRALGFLTAQPNILLLIPDLLLIVWLLSRQSQRSHFQPGRWRWALGILLIPTVLILNDVVPPLIEFLFNQRWYAGAARSPTVSNLVGLLAALTAWPLAGPDSLSKFYQPFFNLYAGLVLIGLGWPIANRKLRTYETVWVALWGFLPIALVFLLSQFFSFLWLERYAVISIPYIAILLAIGWTSLWKQRQRLALIVAAIYLTAVSGPLFRYYTTNYHANWRGLAEEIERYEQPNDLVVVYPGSLLPYLDYYYEGNSNLVAIEESENPDEARAKQIATKMQRLRLLNGRLWLVCPVKDQWNNLRENIFKILAERELALAQTSQMLDHWGWGPTLSLFINLSEADLSEVDLSEADLSEVDLSEINRSDLSN